MSKQHQFVQFWLTCADTIEADTIAKALLEDRLIACAKQLHVSSDFVWKSEIQNDEEVLLVMDSRDDLFDAAEQRIKQLHSYETFVLQAVPIHRVSQAAERWLQDTLRP